MRIDFAKMHGLGNDFIVFDAPTGAPPSRTVLRQLADRRTGIGFDQALVLEPPRRAGSSLFYRIFNADGGEVEQCGNGARCVAALWQRRGRARAGEPIVMESAGGTVRARVLAPELVSVEMGVPSFDPRSLPFDAPDTAADPAPLYDLEVAGETVRIGVVSLGNPHAVISVDSVDAAPVERLGSLIERHPRFPRRVNVGFLEIIDRGRVRLRVYERGVGETLACGTGACAAVAFGRKRDLLDREVSVQAPGGELRVNWEGLDQPIWLTGPAEFAFEGRVEIPARNSNTINAGGGRDMTTREARGVTAAEAEEETVARYLQQHPEFFERHLPLLARLRLPHLRGGSTISLIERQVEVLRERQTALEQKLAEFVQVARSNDQVAERIHRLTRRLFAAKSRAAAVAEIEASLREDFDAFNAVLVLVAPTAELPAHRFLKVVPADDPNLKSFDTLFASGKPRCGQARDTQREFLFGTEAADMGSIALVPLGDKGALGLLALGSHDRDRFHPGMSTEFLGRVADLIADAIARF